MIRTSCTQGLSSSPGTHRASKNSRSITASTTGAVSTAPTSTRLDRSAISARRLRLRLRVLGLAPPRLGAGLRLRGGTRPAVGVLALAYGGAGLRAAPVRCHVKLLARARRRGHPAPGRPAAVSRGLAVRLDDQPAVHHVHPAREAELTDPVRHELDRRLPRTPAATR